MTVRTIARDPSGHQYTGVSSDTKPTATTVPAGSKFWETDTDDVYVNSGAAWVKHQLDMKHVAGERQDSSSTGADHLAVAGEWKSTTVQTNATGDVTVYNGPAVVRMIRVRATTDAGVATTNTAGIIIVKDGTTVKDAAAAGKTPGSTIYDGLDGTQFRTSVILNFASGSDNPNGANGKIEVLYRPLDTIVTW